MKPTKLSDLPEKSQEIISTILQNAAKRIQEKREGA